ncbi:MAG: cysteine--tRNA ligase [Nanoarchaeota archaeon]
MKLYNTLTRKEEEFKPIKNIVGLYTCGPTVYFYAHIGNMKTYIFEDILKRTLLYNKFKVNHIMNITDVGHLTSDQDEGEDKMDLAVKREKKTPKQIADYYSKEFFNDLKLLNILPPNKAPKATDHIKEMIDTIKKIEKNGYAYIGKNNNVYFDTSKVKDYGKLAKLNLEQQKAGARIKVDPNKKHPRDFVLWFSETGSKFKNHLQLWDSPWGKGWPGWHIECSAMSIKYLGEQFDIHCGGEDHISVHHPNEIAQSEAATKKKPWVKYWLHSAFLVMKGKMSKSKGNIIRVKELEEQGYSPLDYRYLVLTAHYRSNLTFTKEALDGAKNSLESLKNKVKEIKENPTSKKTKNNYKKDFLNAINDDLNIPIALSVLWTAIKDNQLGNKEKLTLVKDFDKVLGLNLAEFKKETISKEIKQLIQKREKARKEKDFKSADKIRDDLLKKGIILEDSKNGVKWKKK